MDEYISKGACDQSMALLGYRLGECEKDVANLGKDFRMIEEKLTTLVAAVATTGIAVKDMQENARTAVSVASTNARAARTTFYTVIGMGLFTVLAVFLTHWIGK